ncbi:unnamed protein product [Vitrella brassicaformis CCMP3155]|uniref:nicotinamidase n=1 Tax=Vitrella brassicaformis (strain CCMP3155) TaxID=1169540 RepID=A0A0G4EDW6_VITBC|nr:unnamed protein product [Vitrella brassicaformis CCMP3155]|mmetsp:Transcript_47463/g.118562  ORF Transcript_47463/g.118562 Transcript_47463/m.118562 type:complete len:207 (-) Transcript_47463:1144-1764(-)|eukprot:CEL94160.1 unnamed protein product [Vitrella brassicaformis CCMP3155]
MGKAALIIVDVQNDFCEGGSLAVNEAEEILPVINSLRDKPLFDCVILTCDWHPLDHCSFAANHPGAELFTVKKLPDTGVDQMMWPVHCVAHSVGAAFHPQLKRCAGDLIVRKGLDKTVDSYSGFGSAPEKTELLQLLKDRGIQTVYTVGLATDYCVGSTALDAAKNGFETYVVLNACRGVAQCTTDSMKQKLQEANVKIIQSTDVP